MVFTNLVLILFSEVIKVLVVVHTNYPKQTPLMLLSFKDERNRVNHIAELKVCTRSHRKFHLFYDQLKRSVFTLQTGAKQLGDLRFESLPPESRKSGYFYGISEFSPHAE